MKSQMNSKSANDTPAAPATWRPAPSLSLPSHHCGNSRRPIRPLGHDKRSDPLLSPSRPERKRTPGEMMTPPTPVNNSVWNTMIKCRRRSPSTLANLVVVLSLFIFHNQIAYSKAHQTSSFQQQQQQLPQQASRQWHQEQVTANATARSVSNLINQAAPVAAAAAGAAAASRHQVEESSHNLSSRNHHPTIETPRSQQATSDYGSTGNQRRPLTSDPIEAAAATTSLSGTQHSEVSSDSSASPSDSLEPTESVGSSSSASSDQDESQPADEEAEAGADGSAEEQPSTDEASPTRSLSSSAPPIVRRNDESSVSSSDAYEGIQLRPSRQSQADGQLGPGDSSVGFGGTPTILRTMNLQDSTRLSTASSSGSGGRLHPDGRHAQETSGPSAPRRPPPSSATTSSPMPTSAGSFDLNMGADRMLIKPADDYETRLLLSSAPSPLSGENNQQQHQRHRQSTQPMTATTPLVVAPSNSNTELTQAQRPGAARAPAHQHQTNSNLHELANESVNYHQEMPADGRVPLSSMMSAFNERRLDLAPAAGSNNEKQVGGSFHQPRVGGSSLQQQQQQQQQQKQEQQQQQFIVDSQPQHELAIASICYTPFSLLMVILATILITLIVCLGSYYLFKYFKRHQFDLVANSKHFDHKHLSSSSNGYSHGAASLGGARSLSSQSNYPPTSSLGLLHHHQATPLGAAVCPVHLFQADERCNKCLAAAAASGPLGERLHQAGQLMSDGVSSYAFRNPYFTDELKQQRTAGCQAQQQERRNEGAISSATTAGSGIERDSSRACIPVDLARDRRSPPPPLPSVGLLRAASSTEQMHFIESHIADLHNRQVTSSVKELSSLGADTTQQVVDLTSEEQQARVRAHPKEGDLVAIDLTGHDIIGLGFDVCGNQRDGIFVRSVSSHGPARESGCIQAGDRIKCINVSFDNMTIQDACDILNAGSPYKLRLLIEKKIATVNELNKLQSSNRPTLLSTAGQRRPMMAAMQPPAQQVAIGDDEHRGPLGVTRAYIKRLTSRLLGDETSVDEGRRQLARQQQMEDFQRRDQRMMMAPANNPLLMMNQCKQALPGSGIGAGVGGADGNLYKLAPIGSMTASKFVQQQVGCDFAGAGMSAFGGGSSSPDERTNITNLIDERDMSRGSSASVSGEQQQTNDNKRHSNETTRIQPIDDRRGFGVDQNQQVNKKRQHRRGESCHINGAFHADEIESNDNNSGCDEKDTRVGKYLSRDDSSDMGDFAGLHDDDHSGRPDDDQHQHQQDAEGLYDHERQRKLMASGETFNLKSRLTM